MRCLCRLRLLLLPLRIFSGSGASEGSTEVGRCLLQLLQLAGTEEVLLLLLLEMLLLVLLLVRGLAELPVLHAASR